MHQSKGKYFLFPAFFFFVIYNGYAQDPTSSSWGKRLQFAAKDSTFYLKFGFRFQTLYVGDYDLDVKEYNDAMMIRRSRLKFDGWAIDPSIVYKVELAVSNRDQRSGQIPESGGTANIVLDAAIKWSFTENWQLWWGQTKLPGNRERVISSQQLQFVDRSLVNSRFNLDRDIGIQLRYSSSNDKFRQVLALSLGEGRNIIQDNQGRGHQATARFEYLPMGKFTGKGDYFGSDLKREPTPKLSIGITGDYNINATRSRGNLGGFVTDAEGDYVTTDLSTFIADLMFKYNGFSVMSEYANRGSSNDNGEFGSGAGFVLQGGYLFPSNWELAGRFTTIDAQDQTVFPDTKEYTLGVSKYISGHDLKIQSDISYQNVGNNSDYIIFRVQTEVAL